MDPRGGTPDKPVTFLADPSGNPTDDVRGDVVLDGGGNGAVIRLTGTSSFIIDGFLVDGRQHGHSDPSGSHDVVVRNCQIFENGDDGVLAQDSNDVLLFNNLVFANAGRGFAASGAPGMSLINNTITRNDGRGIFLGPRTTAGTTTASTDAFLRNNIVQDNGTINLQVAMRTRPRGTGTMRPTISSSRRPIRHATSAMRPT